MSQVNVYNLSGGNGSKYISDTSAHTGDFFAIQFLSSSVISALTGNMDGTPTETFGKGDVIYGRWSSVTLSSGTAILYKSS